MQSGGGNFLIVPPFHDRVGSEFEVDIALPIRKPSAIGHRRGFSFAQLVRLHLVDCHDGGYFYCPDICKVIVPIMFSLLRCPFIMIYSKKDEHGFSVFTLMSYNDGRNESSRASQHFIKAPKGDV